MWQSGIKRQIRVEVRRAGVRPEREAGGGGGGGRLHLFSVSLYVSAVWYLFKIN